MDYTKVFTEKENKKLSLLKEQGVIVSSINAVFEDLPEEEVLGQLKNFNKYHLSDGNNYLSLSRGFFDDSTFKIHQIQTINEESGQINLYVRSIEISPNKITMQVEEAYDKIITALFNEDELESITWRTKYEDGMEKTQVEEFRIK